MQGTSNLWLNTLECISAIRTRCSWVSVLFLSTPLDRYSISSASKHSGCLLYGNSWFSLSFLASHPQSSPNTAFTTALIPVAVVICSIVSPSPLGLFLLPLGRPFLDLVVVSVGVIFPMLSEVVVDSCFAIFNRVLNTC